MGIALTPTEDENTNKEYICSCYHYWLRDKDLFSVSYHPRLHHVSKLGCFANELKVSASWCRRISIFHWIRWWAITAAFQEEFRSYTSISWEQFPFLRNPYEPLYHSGGYMGMRTGLA